MSFKVDKKKKTSMKFYWSTQVASPGFEPSTYTLSTKLQDDFTIESCKYPPSNFTILTTTTLITAMISKYSTSACPFLFNLIANPSCYYHLIPYYTFFLYLSIYF